MSVTIPRESDGRLQDPDYLQPALQSHVEVFGDVETGLPASAASTNAWRARRLHTYDADGHYDGDAASPHAGLRFYNDYRHYKFYGFGGRGAKTSWAHNPKSTFLDAREDPRAQLYGLFQEQGSHWHDKPVRKLVSAGRRSVKSSSAMPFRTERNAAKTRRAQASMDLGSSIPKLTLQESRIVGIDLSRLAPAGGRTYYPATGPMVRVVTYPTMLEGDNLLADIASSDAAGRSMQPEFSRSEPPFHQRYSHYKYYGFAGRGAKTSWGSSNCNAPTQR